MKPYINSPRNYSAVILAGGNAKRMGFPKPWLLKGNVTFLSRIIGNYKQFGIEDIVVVLNKKFATPEWENELIEVKNKATIIKNNFPEKGRLYSLQLGLKEAKSDLVFIHNVDNPFVETEVLEELVNGTASKGITIPIYQKKGGHPVIISKLVKKEIENNYQNYETLKDIFSNFTKKYIEIKSSSILKNINTPEELKEARHELIE